MKSVTSWTMVILLGVTTAYGASSYMGELGGPPTSAEVWSVPRLDDPRVAEVSPERQALEELVRAQSPIRADEVILRMVGDWAFADVAERDAKSGDWLRSDSALLQKGKNGWKILTWGDYMEWDSYTKKMPPKVKQAFEQWKGSHF